MIRVTAIGECMMELTSRSDTELSLAFAGDTFNTALYLARATEPHDVAIDYMTAVGTDWYSEQLLQVARSEGVGTSLVQRLPGRVLGLYLVRTDARGKRSFTYYRSESAARELFGSAAAPQLDQAVVESDVIYLSAITLQILTPSAREHLWGLLAAARRQGGRVVFDSNYRAGGWPNRASAVAAIERTLETTDIYLPTFGDEQALFDDADLAACLSRLSRSGIEEVVLKNGEHGCVVLADGAVDHVPAEPVFDVVDTTAAGDSFNAGYLAARLAGGRPLVAARKANELAAMVIGHPGAIVPTSALAPRA